MAKIKRAFVITASSGLLEAANALLEADDEKGIDNPEAALKKIITSLVSSGTGNRRVVLYLEPQDLRTYGPSGGNKALAELLVKERADEVTGFFNNPYHAKNKTSFIQVFTNDFNLGALNGELGQRAILLDVPNGKVSELIALGAKNAKKQAEALTELLRHKYYVASVVPGKITKGQANPKSTDVDELEPNFNIEAVIGYTEADVRQAALDANKQQAEVKAQKDAEAGSTEQKREDEDMPAYKFADAVDSYIADNLQGKMPTDEAGAKELSAFIRQALNDASGNNPKVKRSMLRPEMMSQIFHVPRRRNQVQLLAHGAIDDYLTTFKKPSDVEAPPATSSEPAAEKPAEKPAASGDLIQQIIKNYDIRDAGQAPDVLKTLFKDIQTRLKD
jgi:hypothetical protein